MAADVGTGDRMTDVGEAVALGCGVGVDAAVEVGRGVKVGANVGAAASVGSGVFVGNASTREASLAVRRSGFWWAIAPRR
jgi:UDP-3-O-[3-hydroxymyristoyl] glucosamine N-acyltransferase